MNEEVVKMMNEIAPAVRGEVMKYLSEILTARTDGFPQYITPKGLADKACVSLQTVSNWEKSGLITIYRIGSKRLIRVDEAIAFLQQNPSK